MSGWLAAVQVTVSNTVHRWANTSQRESCNLVQPARRHRVSCPQPNNSNAASRSRQKNPHSTAQFSKLPCSPNFSNQRKPAAPASPQPHAPSPAPRANTTQPPAARRTPSPPQVSFQIEFYSRCLPAESTTTKSPQ